MYNKFAYVYDKLMQDIDYNKWKSYIINILNKNGIKSTKILDLACGTGNITIPLAQTGYDMYGVDISQEMLSIADQKSYSQNLKIKWINNDICKLNMNEKFDAIICCCDGLNYILEKDDLSKVFQSVHNLLLPGGVFTFDINSFYKINHIFGNNTYTYNSDQINYIWNNYFDEDTRIVEFDLTFFIKENNDLYSKFNERHFQKAYFVDEIENMLLKIGYDVSVHDFLSFTGYSESSERIQFVARKQ